MRPSSPVEVLEQTTSLRNNSLVIFLSTAELCPEAELEQLGAARPRRPGNGERCPALRMARPQPPPWVHAAFLLCFLGLGGAIEIPMDREFFSFFYSPDLGQRTVKTNFQRMLGEGKQWILDAELGFPKMGAGRWCFGR